MNEFDRCIDEWAELVAQRNATIVALEQRVKELETNLFGATATVASLENRLAEVEHSRDRLREALRGMEAERNRLNEILKTYVLAMDKLYNHNEAVREAVVMYFGVIHPSETLSEEPICHECGWEIDPEMCWCGDSVTHNSYNAGHTPVPHGCTCGYVDAERRRKPGWTPIRLRS